MWYFLAENWYPTETQTGLFARFNLYIKLGIVSLPQVCALTWIFLLFQPCIPMNLGIVFVPQCYPPNLWNRNLLASIFGILVHIFLSTFVAWLFLFSGAITVLHYIAFSTSPCLCFINYAYLFKRHLLKLQNSSIISAIQIWREIQLFAKKCTIL